MGERVGGGYVPVQESRNRRPTQGVNTKGGTQGVVSGGVPRGVRRRQSHCAWQWLRILTRWSDSATTCAAQQARCGAGPVQQWHVLSRRPGPLPVPPLLTAVVSATMRAVWELGMPPDPTMRCKSHT